MKFKEQRGSVFVFDGGYAGGELELLEHRYSDFYELLGTDVSVREDLSIWHEDHSCAPYKDIQTAVNLMQILINEGLV